MSETSLDFQLCSEEKRDRQKSAVVTETTQKTESAKHGGFCGIVCLKNISSHKSYYSNEYKI